MENHLNKQLIQLIITFFFSCLGVTPWIKKDFASKFPLRDLHAITRNQVSDECLSYVISGSLPGFSRMIYLPRELN